MEFLTDIKSLRIKVNSFVLKNEADLEAFRIQFLGKKGLLADCFDRFRDLPNDHKRQVGKLLNELKAEIESRYFDAKGKWEKKETNLLEEDITKPYFQFGFGNRHPITQIQNEIITVFERIGFNVALGPEMEDDWHNFSALNFPEEHPARDMQDTFFVEKSPDWALRTHTSSIQVRVMGKQTPPIRILAPGRVFRNEAISSRAHCIFHQIEGLYIDRGVSFADLKQTLLYFAQEFFGKETKIRLRPSYFPFTEPSAEMDVYWGLKSESDYRITKGTGWLEVMGCGMVDPHVLRSSGIDSSIYSGFAFGMGIERIAMNRYQIPDLRHFFENDMRFVKQF